MKMYVFEIATLIISKKHLENVGFWYMGTDIAYIYNEILMVLQKVPIF